MNKSEIHYLSCQDRECERFACVARRDYEVKLASKDRQIEEIQKARTDDSTIITQKQSEIVRLGFEIERMKKDSQTTLELYNRMVDERNSMAVMAGELVTLKASEVVQEILADFTVKTGITPMELHLQPALFDALYQELWKQAVVKKKGKKSASVKWIRLHSTLIRRLPE